MFHVPEYERTNTNVSETLKWLLQVIQSSIKVFLADYKNM